MPVQLDILPGPWSPSTVCSSTRKSRRILASRFGHVQFWTSGYAHICTQMRGGQAMPCCDRPSRLSLSQPIAALHIWQALGQGEVVVSLEEWRNGGKDKKMNRFDDHSYLDGACPTKRPRCGSFAKQQIRIEVSRTWAWQKCYRMST